MVNGKEKINKEINIINDKLEAFKLTKVNNSYKSKAIIKSHDCTTYINQELKLNFDFSEDKTQKSPSICF